MKEETLKVNDVIQLTNNNEVQRFLFQLIQSHTCKLDDIIHVTDGFSEMITNQTQERLSPFPSVPKADLNSEYHSINFES